MKRLALLPLVLLASLAVAAPSSAMVRKESQWWVWYVPKANWVAAQSAEGIDITSPTGTLYVGYAFSATPRPWTHREVIDLIVSNNAMDPHRERNVRIGNGSRVRRHGAVYRWTYKWTAYRADRNERIRGFLTVDIIRDDSTYTYGFGAYNRSAPVGLWDRWNERLTRVQKNIRFKPRSPDFDF